MFRPSALFGLSIVMSLCQAASAQPTFHVAGTGGAFQAVDINASGAILMWDSAASNGGVTRVWHDGAVTTFSGSEFDAAAANINWSVSGCLRAISFEPQRLMNDGTVYGKLSIQFIECNPPGTTPGIGIFIARRRGAIGQAGTFEILRDVGEVLNQNDSGAGISLAVQEAGNSHIVSWSQYYCTQAGPGTFCDAAQNAFPGDGTGTYAVGYSRTSNIVTSSVYYPWSSPVSCQQAGDPCNNGENPFQIGVANSVSLDRFDFGAPKSGEGCSLLGSAPSAPWLGKGPSPEIFGSRQVICDWTPYSPAWQRGFFRLSTATPTQTPFGFVSLPATPLPLGTRYLWHDGSEVRNRGMLYRNAVFNSSGEAYVQMSRVQSANMTSQLNDDADVLMNVWVRFPNGSLNPNLSGMTEDGDVATLSESGDFYFSNTFGSPKRLFRYNHGFPEMQRRSTLVENERSLCQRYPNQPRQTLTMASAPAGMWTNNSGDLMIQSGDIYLYTPSTNKIYPVVYPGLPFDATRSVTGVQTGPIILNTMSSGNNGSSNPINDSRQMVVQLTLSDGSNVIARADFSPNNYDVLCGDIDFNNDGVFPDDQDIIDFLDVLSGGTCATCDSIDINRDGVFPDDADVTCFFNILQGGNCEGACECEN